MRDKLRPDEQVKEQELYVLEYPGPAGRPICNAKPAFARSRQANLQAGEAPWSPFGSKDEWGFVLWILQNLGHRQIDDLLKLDFVRSSYCWAAWARVRLNIWTKIDKKAHQSILLQLLHFLQDGRQYIMWS